MPVQTAQRQWFSVRTVAPKWCFTELLPSLKLLKVWLVSGTCEMRLEPGTKKPEKFYFCTSEY